MSERRMNLLGWFVFVFSLVYFVALNLEATNWSVAMGWPLRYYYHSDDGIIGIMPEEQYGLASLLANMTICGALSLLAAFLVGGVWDTIIKNAKLAKRYGGPIFQALFVLFLYVGVYALQWPRLFRATYEYRGIDKRPLERRRVVMVKDMPFHSRAKILYFPITTTINILSTWNSVDRDDPIGEIIDRTRFSRKETGASASVTVRDNGIGEYYAVFVVGGRTNLQWLDDMRTEGTGQGSSKPLGSYLKK